MATKNPLDPSLTNPFLPAYSAPGGRDYNPAYGGVPSVPNPLATAKKAITGDVELLPDLKSLGRGVNAQLFGQYTSRIPNYSDIAAASSKNIENLIHGVLPEDVLYNLGQKAAERGVGAGVGGSPFETSEYLRALGLTSLDLMGKGEEAFTGAMGRLKDIPFFDVSKFLVTPEDEQAAGTEAAKLASAPNPAAAARNELDKLRAGLRQGIGGGGPAGFEDTSQTTGNPYWDVTNPSSPFYDVAQVRKF